MRLRNIFKSIGKFIVNKFGILSYIIIFIIFIWFFYFIHQNVYQTVITPKKINPNEIIAKRKKVDLTLFNTTSEKVKKKMNIDRNVIKSIRNPF